MSDITVVILLIAVAIAQVFVYFAVDVWIQVRGNAIETGLIRGVSVSIRYRRVLLNLSWLLGCLTVVAMHAVLSLGYMVIGRSASVEEVSLFAYLLSFAAAGIAVAWLVLVPFWYAHYQSTLRQAEAD